MLQRSTFWKVFMSSLDGPQRQDASAPFGLIAGAKGLLLEMHPSKPSDYGRVADHLYGMSAEDRYCRFLSAISISPAVVEYFVERTASKVTFLAVDEFDKVAGMVTLVTTGQPGHAEVGMSVTACYRRKGVGSALLDRVVRIASDRGLAVLQAVTSAQNVPLHQMAARAGFRPVPYLEDRTLVALQRVVEPITT